MDPNERLIRAIQTGFSDLAAKTETQGENLHSRLKYENDKLISVLTASFEALGQNGNRVHKALEALKPEAPIKEKTTVFWDYYKTVADEHDKEFQEKYSTDFDTALIFAGLFSAVSSAFIIQIQPELRQDPNTTNQALLRLLIQSVNGTVSFDDTSNPNWTGPPRIIVAVQSLLYVSLLTALLAALLSVLGKQWLLSYSAVGSRGTVEERGIDRQRKFDGLRKSKLFEIVMHICPLLLQLALLLFAVALSIYLQTIHRSIAGIVLMLTALGIIIYLCQLISAILSPDSPFQTPLASLCIKLISPSQLLVLRNYKVQLQHFVFQLWSRMLDSSLAVGSQTMSHFVDIRGIFPNKTRESSAKLVQDTIRLRQPQLFTEEFPHASHPTLYAILWVLETSTDPELITAAASMAADPDIQWPLELQLDPPLTRLSESFIACFNISHDSSLKIRDGCIDRAICYGQAYGILKINSRSNQHHSLEDYLKTHSLAAIADNWKPEPAQLADLRRVYTTLQGSAECFQGLQAPAAIRWTLRVLPSRIRGAWNSTQLSTFFTHFLTRLNLDQVNYANYLLFMTVSLGFRPDPGDLAWMDKSRYTAILLTAMFKNLTKRLSLGTIDSKIAAKVVKLTGQLTENMESIKSDLRLNNRRQSRETFPALEATISQFCSLYHFHNFRNGNPQIRDRQRWVDVVLIALQHIVVRTDIDGVHHDPSSMPEGAKLRDVSWVYRALEDVHGPWNAQKRWTSRVTTSVGALLQALLHARGLHQKPTEEALLVLIRALSIDEVSELAFQVFASAKSWFKEEDVREIMQRNSWWSHAGKIARKDPGRYVGGLYIDIGAELADLPEWRTVIETDIPSWIDVFVSGRRQEYTKFNSVLFRVWGAEYKGTYEFENEAEKTSALIFTALSNIWNAFKPSESTTPLYITNQLIALTKCTAITALVKVSANFKATFSAHLGDALDQAGTKVRMAMRIPEFFAPGLSEELARTLEAMGGKLKGEPDITRQVSGSAISSADSGVSWEEFPTLLMQRDVEHWNYADDAYWEGLKERFVADIDALEVGALRAITSPAEENWSRIGEAGEAFRQQWLLLESVDQRLNQLWEDGDTRHTVRSWATWQPDPNMQPTPASYEVPLLVPESGSPGLFGPRSPRESLHDHTVRSWATWQPDPNIQPTPTSHEVPLLIPESASPSLLGLFGLRSPRESLHNEPAPLVPESASPSLFGLFGPGSPRESLHDEPAPLVPESASPGLFGPRSPRESLHDEPAVPESSSPSLFGPRSPRESLHDEPAPLAPESASPGLFGPRSPRESLHNEPAPLVPESASPGLFGPRSPRESLHDEPAPLVPESALSSLFGPGSPQESLHDEPAPPVPESASPSLFGPGSPRESLHGIS